MEEGYSFDQIVDEFASMKREERRAKAPAMAQVRELLKQGKVEEARRFAEEQNAALREQGFNEIVITPRQEETFRKLGLKRKENQK